MFRHRVSEASDADLISRTRSGEEAAYEELWRRHAASGLTVARSLTSSLDPEDLVQESFVRVFTAVRKGGGPKGAFRPYLFTTIRNTAAEWGRKRRETSIDTLDSLEDPATSDEEADAALDRSLTAVAFRSLPTRWQEVLWYSEVEQMAPAAIAPLLGMKANSVAALTYRAREGLRQAWIQAHIRSAPEGSPCRWNLERMGSYTRDGLGKRDLKKFELHLDECARCTIVAAEAREVGSRIALVLLPLTIGATGASGYLAWLQAGEPVAVMAMPAGVAGAVGSSVGAAGAASGAGAGSGSASAGAGGAGGSSAGGMSVGAVAIGGTLVAGVIAASIAAALIFSPGSTPVAEEAPGGGTSQQAAPPSNDTSEDAAPADEQEEPPAEEPPADEPVPQEPPAEDPPADEAPPANEAPPADDPPADEPPAEDPPPEEPKEETPPTTVSAPSGIAQAPNDGTSYPVVSGTADPGSVVTLAAEPSGDASTASVAGSVRAPDDAADGAASTASVFGPMGPAARAATTPTQPYTASAARAATALAQPYAASAASSASPFASSPAATANDAPLSARVDDDGNWSIVVKLDAGSYTVTATAESDGATSDPSAPFDVTVGSGPEIISVYADSPIAYCGFDNDCAHIHDLTISAAPGSQVTITVRDDDITVEETVRLGETSELKVDILERLGETTFSWSSDVTVEYAPEQSSENTLPGQTKSLSEIDRADSWPR